MQEEGRAVMGMREEIAEAIVEAQMCADTGQPLSAARYADAAMGAFEARLAELEVKARKDYSDDPWDHGYLRAIKDMRGEQ
ncbi:hypothetical protein ACIRPH_31295 [Nocardiopsis sp. NPDC101807]|uniref:hypothetical protein n=1 Tax=Nocardiopsis sp. NPDC101807 TaxID=3364339 RepID=UPI0037FC1DF8